MAEPKLLDQVASVLQLKHYSPNTSTAYINWIKRFILFHNKCHPRDMGEPEISEFLTHLARKQNVSASTQNQAFNAVLFLYRQTLHKPLAPITDVVRARRPRKLPVVLTKDEARRILSGMSSVSRLMACLLYGSGLRIQECARLRMKDIDFQTPCITVCNGKGEKDRITLLPISLIPSLKNQMQSVIALHRRDKLQGFGEVSLPYALDRKYPRAASELGWQYLFPSSSRSHDPHSGKVRRHHLDESSLQRAIKDAVRQSGILKAATPHSFRHSFATHLLEAGYDIATVQKLLGHRDIRTTMIYIHVALKRGLAVKSPLD